MRLESRPHEFGPDEPRMRVWTEEQSGYGQFDILEYEDYQTLKRLFAKYHWTLVEHN